MEATDESLHEQANILKEIRDEIRTSRTTNPYSGQASGAGRPSGTFVQSQMFMDRLASGEWASMGWSNAYKSQIRSSWSNDLQGAMGFMRSTNTMTQMEFQAMSANSLDQRIGKFMGGIISPYHTGMVANLGQDIFENSQRFARFGDSNTGIMGSGINMNAATSLARSVTSLGFKDMRMNSQDYGDTVSIGMKMSQYDHIRGTEDFMKKTKEMASAVADLTRTLHLSVKEIAEGMGSLRQHGIIDVADQRRTLMGIQAQAQVGGLSTGQAMQTFQQGIQAGASMGIAAQVSGHVALANLTGVREASRSGTISANVMALGGGAEGIAQSITSAQLKHLSSTAGYLQYLGGAGGRSEGDSIQDMMRGLGELNTFDKMLSGQARKMEFLEKLKDDPNKVNQLYVQNIERQIRMTTGDKNFDMTGEGARDRAFALVRGQMGDAAGMAFANTNFTERGRMDRDSVAWRADRAAQVQENKLAYDTWAITHTAAGRLEGSLKGFRSIPGEISNDMATLWNGNGQVGWTDWGSKLLKDQQAHDMGAIPDTVPTRELLRALQRRGKGEDFRTPESFTFEAPNDVGSGTHRFETAGKWIGGAFGSAGGPLLIATSYIGGKIGKAIGDAYDTTRGLNMDHTEIKGEEAIGYGKALKAYHESDKVSYDDRMAVRDQLLKDSPWFREKVFLDRGEKLKPHETLQYTRDVSEVARQHGYTDPMVYAAMEETGGGSSHVPLGGYKTNYDSVYFTGDEQKQQWKWALEGVKSMEGLDLGNTATLVALQDLITSGDVTDPANIQGSIRRTQAEKTLKAQGVKKEDIGRFMENEGVDLFGRAYHIELPKKLVPNMRGPGSHYVEGTTGVPVYGDNIRGQDFSILLKKRIEAGSDRELNNSFETATRIVRSQLGESPIELEDFEKRFGRGNNMIGLLELDPKDPIMQKLLERKGDSIIKKAQSVQGMKIEDLIKEGANPFNFSKKDLGEIQANIKENKEKGTPLDDVGIRRMIEAMIITGAGATKEDKTRQIKEEAQMFRHATMILAKLAKELKLPE